jgi:hypothetical protein
MRLLETFTAATPKQFEIPGNYFFLDSLPGGLATVRFSRSGRLLPEDLTDVMAGWYAAPTGGFDAVEITSSLTQAVSFYIARGQVGSNVFSGNVAVSKPTTIDTVADVALGAGVATQIVPLDAARRQALITNLQANVNIIRVGDANVGAARGVQVAPGQTITLDGTEAIFGFDAAAESVGVLVIKD